MAHNDQRGGSRKRVVILVILAVVLAGAGLYGIPMIVYALHHESTDDAFIEGTVAAVSFRTQGHVQAVHVDDNERVKEGDLIAELDPKPYRIRLQDAEAALAAAHAKLTGLETEVALAEATAAAEQEAAAAGVAVAKAELAAARTRISVATQDIEDARIGVKVAAAEEEEDAAAAAAAEAQADLDATDLDRARSLYEKKTITRSDLDHAEAAANVSKARLAAARKAVAGAEARLEQARTHVQVAEGDLAQARAGVDRAQAALEEALAKQKSAQTKTIEVGVAKAAREEQRAAVDRSAADLESAKLDLGYASLLAPVAGRVTKKSLTVGAWVEPGQAVLALVPDGVWVVANYKETQIQHIRPGQRVRIAVDAFPDQAFTGRVDSIQAGTGSRFSLLPAENATGNYVKVVQRIPVKILFDPLPDLDRFPLSPGMSVVPDIAIQDP